MELTNINDVDARYYQCTYQWSKEQCKNPPVLDVVEDDGEWEGEMVCEEHKDLIIADIERQKEEGTYAN